MHGKLVGIAGPRAGETFDIAAPEARIGRGQSNWLVIPSTLVSRHHCLLEAGPEGGWTITDLDSHNGTYVNDVPVKRRHLRHGDQIRVGESLLVFLTHEETLAPEEGEFATQSELTLKLEGCVYLQPPGEDASLAEKHLNALLRISSSILSARDVETLQRELTDRIFELLPAHRAAVLWRDSPDAQLAAIFSRSRDEGSAAGFVPSRTVIDKVLERGEAVLSNEIAADSGLASAESLMAARVRSVLAVPLQAMQQLRGILYLDTVDPRSHFSEEHLQVLAAIGVLAAVALDNAFRTEWLVSENRRLQTECGLSHEMIGESPPMRALYDRIARVARTGSTVLLCGESGTGKELAARAVHFNSERAAKPFVPVNCAALAETLLESELFGHEKGAFTGAIGQKKGRIEVAEGGTLFLDEIGELAPAMQAKLLRVLQEREFERVGGTRPIRADIRLIAASNRPLDDAVKQGSFRQDLYYRLNVVNIAIPSLRERRDDIPLLCAHFLNLYAKRCGRVVQGVSPQARQCFLRYDWPGNVRELQNIIERAVVLGASDLILPEDLPEELHAAEPGSADPLPRYLEAVQDTKRAQILKAIEEAGGNITAAAKILGLHPNYLHRLIRNLGLRSAVKKASPPG